LEVSGKAAIFGSNVSTDAIFPSKYMTSLDPLELAKHAMEGVDSGFAQKAQESLIVIAGSNFGCGSSREQAPLALKYAGVKCVLAESFARIFYRNAINIGLPVLELPESSKKIEEGDMLTISLEEGKVMNQTKGLILDAPKLPEFILDIIRAGGLVEHLKQTGGTTR